MANEMRLACEALEALRRTEFAALVVAGDDHPERRRCQRGARQIDRRCFFIGKIVAHRASPRAYPIDAALRALYEWRGIPL